MLRAPAEPGSRTPRALGGPGEGKSTLDLRLQDVILHLQIVVLERQLYYFVGEAFGKAMKTLVTGGQ